RNSELQAQVCGPHLNPIRRLCGQEEASGSVRTGLAPSDGYPPGFQELYRGKPMAEKKSTSAFNKPLVPSPELAVIVGKEPLARTEVTKRLWDYIKAHNRQNPANKRNILCDDKLK